jgi:hypothetical protein
LIGNTFYNILHFPSEKQTQEIQLWGGGGHGESFDETTVLDKAKHGIVVAVFAGLTLGSFKDFYYEIFDALCHSL